MKSKRVFFRNFLIILTLILFAFSAAVFTMNFFENKKEHFFESDAKITVSDSNSSQNQKSDSECQIQIEIPLRADGTQNAWRDGETNGWGAQYDIYIENFSDAVLCEWNLKITLPCHFEIDSAWNGNFQVDSADENSIFATGQDSAWNLAIRPCEKGKIGFVLYTPELLKSCKFELSYHLEKSILKDARFILLNVFLGICGLLILIYFAMNFMLERQKKNSSKTIEDLITLISHFIDARDTYTREHSYHVGKYSRLLAEKLGFTGENLQNVYYLGLLHDVGKVLIPSEILQKAGKLTDAEWEIMKKHTTYGAEILKDFNHIPQVRDAVLYHHERYDGKGYMAGLSGENIPLGARIICVADSYDAMATDRAYRKALPKDVILSEIKKNSGTQFDPKIATKMIELMEEGKI